jgi:hypothetical protein
MPVRLGLWRLAKTDFYPIELLWGARAASLLVSAASRNELFSGYFFANLGHLAKVILPRRTPMLVQFVSL